MVVVETSRRSESARARAIMHYLRHPKLNKGMTFTEEERRIFGITGLVPATRRSQEQEMKLCKDKLDSYTESIHKYMFLSDLQDQNEKLFFRLFMENVGELLPLVYTPVVGEACLKLGTIYNHPKGLFISYKDKGNIQAVLTHWPEKKIRAICVTDGERILGLGDLGAHGMGIPVGKLALYTGLGKIDPSICLPVTLDVGTENQSLLDDPFYMGLRQKRVRGKDYDDFVDEFMQAVTTLYGPNTLIQFEDFGNSNASRLLEKYQNSYCTFNDDIQGTASVVLSGIITSLKIVGTHMKDHKFLFVGAGGATLGIANLIVMYMEGEGVARDQARSQIWISDTKGLVTTGRSAETTLGCKRDFLQHGPVVTDMLEMVRFVKPTVLIGASTQKGIFSPEVLTEMGKLNSQPIIFALSNPTSRAECTAEEAYTNTDCRAIFASGSPFPPFESKGQRRVPGQGNNAYIFPGIGLGVISVGVTRIPQEIFLLAAKTLSALVDQEQLDVGCLYPPQQKIFQASIAIAVAVVDFAYRKGLTTHCPEPTNKEAFVRGHLYDPTY